MLVTGLMDGRVDKARESTPFFERLCPAMTNESPRACLSSIVTTNARLPKISTTAGAMRGTFVQRILVGTK